MSRYIFALILSVVVAVVGFQVWPTTQADDDVGGDSTNEPLPVIVDPAIHVTEITQARQFTGTLKARRESQLSFEQPGRLLSIEVDEGDSVAEGQLLAQIDVELVQADLATAQAQLDHAQAVLDELIAGPRKEQIESMRSRVASLDSVARGQEQDFQRSQRLLGAQSISRELNDSRKFQYLAATSERDSAQRQLDELLAGTRPERLAAQRATVKQLQSQIAKLRLSIEDGELRAPFAGRVRQRLVDEGTVVSPGVVVLHLVEDQFLEAWVGVPPATARALSTEQVISVEGREIPALVRSRRPALDTVTRTQNVVLHIDPQHADGMVSGQIVRLNVSENTPCDGVLVPTTALTPGPRGLWNVFVVFDDGGVQRVQRRSVDLLYSINEASLVSGTLEDGDLVVVDGVHRVVVGQEVVATLVTRKDRE